MRDGVLVTDFELDPGASSYVSTVDGSLENLLSYHFKQPLLTLGYFDG